jgi:hypothetical protein
VSNHCLVEDSKGHFLYHGLKEGARRIKEAFSGDGGKAKESEPKP